MRVITYTFNRIFVPLVLVVLCPLFALMFVFFITEIQGSFSTFLHLFQELGLLRWINVSVLLPTKYALLNTNVMAGLGGFALIQLLFMRFLPGEMVSGPRTPHGHVPEYKKNGPISFYLTLILYIGLSKGLKLFSPGWAFNNILHIVSLMNIFSLVFCLFLYIKGLVAPSNDDQGSSKNPLFDYYWGTELYPKVLGFDIKRWATCRMGMMGWAVLIISYAFYQHEVYVITNSMILSVVLQFLYINKFFEWEIGYLRSLDIMHDRAGFYICWGVLVWIPALYTSPTMYMTLHPYNLPLYLFIPLLIIGILTIGVNYHADYQRTKFREDPQNTRIFGKPAKYITAHYTDEKGDKHTGYLLISGYWRMSRHFHYLPEIIATFLWSVGVGFGSAVPFLYVIFLVILLSHRFIRDENRCSAKYGKYWDEYKAVVPSVIVPGLLLFNKKKKQE